MSRNPLKSVRAAVGEDVATFAARLEVECDTVIRWEMDATAEIPPRAMDVLKKLAAWHNIELDR